MGNYYFNPHDYRVHVSTPHGSNRIVLPGHGFQSDTDFYDRFVGEQLEVVDEESFIKTPQKKVFLSSEDPLKRKPPKYREEKLVTLPMKRLKKIADKVGVSYDKKTHRLELVWSIVRLNEESRS